MASTDERAFEAVILANTFRHPRGRAFVAEFFPASVLALYDAVVARDEWRDAQTLTEQALVIVRVLETDAVIAAAYQADVDAGELGFGADDDAEIDAAIDEVRGIIDPPLAMAEPPPDGLLGGDGEGPVANGGWRPPRAPATPRPPLSLDGDEEEPAPAEPADTIESWLNADLDSGGAPLAVARPYTLAVYFGAAGATTVASARASVAIPRSDEAVDLTVEVTSSDFTVPPFPQQVRLGRDGRSGRALFEIVPQHDGPSRLTVIVTAKGNFVQRLDITFDVGASGDAEAQSYGRPAGAAAVLDERLAALQITVEDWGYELIARQVSPDPIRIEVTPLEIGARIKAVREALLRAVKPVALRLDVTDEENAAMLSDIAFAGFRLYQTVFEGDFASPELRAVGRWLREGLGHDVDTLQIVSRGFPVPWALMYVTERFEPDKLTWADFIGMHTVVEQIPLTRIAAAPPSTTIESTPELTVRALFNDDIDAQMPSKPITAQRDYWTARGVALTQGTSADDLMRDALAAGAHDKVIYLFCHAEANAKDPDENRLILTGSQRVTLGDLKVFAPTGDRLDGHPIVFINACESGNITPEFNAGFVSYFLGKGARGVVGTECKTPGLFASEWAKVFFDQLFAGQPLGKAVLHARTHFLDEHKNPLGLVYGVHCDTDTVVVPELATT